MKENQLAALASLIGLIVVLIGLILRATHNDLFAIPFEGAGASILATGITAWIIINRNATPYTATLLEVLAEGTQIRRMNQTVDLYFSISNNRVSLTKIHSYSLFNPGRRSIKRKLSMYTDLPTDCPDAGQFISVETPTDGILKDDHLSTYISRDAGKEHFSKLCTLPPGESGRFVFESKADFRLSDRLIWTVQDLSDSFAIKINNELGHQNPFSIKINHHRDLQIYDTIRTSNIAGKEIINFIIPFTILPYQGFEISWSISPQVEVPFSGAIQSD